MNVPRGEGWVVAQVDSAEHAAPLPLCPLAQKLSQQPTSVPDAAVQL